MVWASRYQGRVPYSPQMAVAAYPSALQRLSPDVLATPWTPQAPVAPAAPSQVPMAAEAPMMGPMVGAMDNWADSDGPGYAGDMPGPSPNQSIGGMLDAGLTGLSLLGGPLGAAGLLGGFAVAADRGLTNPALGPLSVMAQIAGLGTLGQTVDGMFGGGSGAWGDNIGSSFAQAGIGVDPATGVIATGPFAGAIDMTSPLAAAGLEAAMGGGGFGGGMSSQDFGDTSPNAFGGNSSMGDFGGLGIGSGFGGGSAGGAGMGGTADGSTGW